MTEKSLDDETILRLAKKERSIMAQLEGQLEQEQKRKLEEDRYQQIHKEWDDVATSIKNAVILELRIKAYPIPEWDTTPSLELVTDKGTFTIEGWIQKKQTT